MRFIPSIIAVLIALFGIVKFLSTKKKAVSREETGPLTKEQKRSERSGLIILIVGLWFLLGSLSTLIFGKPAAEKFTFDIIPPRADFTIFGYQPSETLITGWGIVAVLIIVAVILRIFFIPKLSDTPGNFQNVMETIIEIVESYASGRTVFLGRPMFGYVFAVGITLIGNAVAELMGFRSPSSDLMFTMALAIFAFLIANWYAIRKLSVKGRLKSMAYPSPLLLPVRLVSDLANPLSMACRLFGNTLSSMIVMGLIYSSLGNFAFAIPSVVGLYFNVFSALIQTVIFVTLALSTINDATTEPIG